MMMMMRADHCDSQAEPHAQTAQTKVAQAQDQAEQPGDPQRLARGQAELPIDVPRCDQMRAEPWDSQTGYMKGQAEQVTDVSGQMM